MPVVAGRVPAPPTALVIRLDDFVPGACVAAQPAKQRALRRLGQLVADGRSAQVVYGRIVAAWQRAQQARRQLLGRLGGLGLDRLHALVPVRGYLLAGDLRLQAPHWRVEGGGRERRPMALHSGMPHWRSSDPVRGHEAMVRAMVHRAL
jgi:hypothetical protein